MEQPGTGNWWTRNWKWFVPVGCLSMILLGVAFFGAILMAAVGSMKSSDAYKEGLARAQASSVVVEALGSPIEAGFFTSGNVSINGSSGTAQLSIPISGPKGSGTITLEAEKSGGKWTFSKLEVTTEKTGEKIDLRSSS